MKPFTLPQIITKSEEYWTSRVHNNIIVKELYYYIIFKQLNMLHAAHVGYRFDHSEHYLLCHILERWNWDTCWSWYYEMNWNSALFWFI